MKSTRESLTNLAKGIVTRMLDRPLATQVVNCGGGRIDLSQKRITDEDQPVTIGASIDFKRRSVTLRVSEVGQRPGIYHRVDIGLNRPRVWLGNQDKHHEIVVVGKTFHINNAAAENETTHPGDALWFVEKLQK